MTVAEKAGRLLAGMVPEFRRLQSQGGLTLWSMPDYARPLFDAVAEFAVVKANDVDSMTPKPFTLRSA